MSLRIVFMGTPDFAVPTLKALHEAGYQIVGVITATDKYGGRGNKKLIESPVKKYAEANHLKVLQPRNLKSPEFIKELSALKADLQIVVAFRMLPVVVWDMPPLGTMNLHGSLLPKYRGAAPINWAIINGEQETGVTTFFLKHEIDTGDMLLQEKISIGKNETAGSVHDRMMEMGAAAVLKSVRMIEQGNYNLIEQDDSQVSKAPKIYTETCEIDFAQHSESVHNFIRGLSPYPTAWTMLGEQKLKIYLAEPLIDKHEYPVGKIISDNKSFIKIATLDGFINILDLQLQGRKRMQTKAFLNGYKFEDF